MNGKPHLANIGVPAITTDEDLNNLPLIQRRQSKARIAASGPPSRPSSIILDPALKVLSPTREQFPMIQEASENYQCTSILPWLLFGSELTAYHYDTLNLKETQQRIEEHKIGFIISTDKECHDLSAEVKNGSVQLKGFRGIHLEPDNHTDSLSKQLDEFTNYIDQIHNKEPETVVYVQCKVGNELSPALIIAYLIRRKHFTYDEALFLLQQLRSDINIPWDITMLLQ